VRENADAVRKEQSEAEPVPALLRPQTEEQLRRRETQERERRSFECGACFHVRSAASISMPVWEPPGRARPFHQPGIVVAACAGRTGGAGEGGEQACTLLLDASGAPSLHPSGP